MFYNNDKMPIILAILLVIGAFIVQEVPKGIIRTAPVPTISTDKLIETLLTGTPTPMTTQLLTPIPTPLLFQKTSINPIPTTEWGKTIRIDDKTSASRFAPDDHMSTTDELFTAMNEYRRTHNLPSLSKNGTLCDIAQNRADELLRLGRLDNHEGASKYMHSQREFNTIDEVLFGGIQPVAGVHIVEWGWDKSLTGHHEAISDPVWHDGCAGIAGYFAVFEFGAR